jgi:uncharacterized protein YndB with AHSA1/START domain
MSDYEFVTIWNIDAPLTQVWDAIEDADAWPEWWRGVLRSVETRKGDDDGVGSIRRTTWKSALPYKLEFDSETVRVERYRLIEIRAFGELDGRGLWQFEEISAAKTRVQYDWTVKTTKAWMNLLAPIARPFFRWNHDTIMRWGEEGLKKLLGL